MDLDDDVLLAVKERARREGRTMGAVLSDLARQTLTGQTLSDLVASPARHGFRSLPRRGRAVSNSMIDQLREDEGP